MLKGKKVLFVEDDALVRISAATFFKKEGAVFYGAPDGNEGYEIFIQTSPDIIITDLRMPIMHGEEMINKIRGRNNNVPIVVMTANSDMLQEKSLADAILSKPVNFRDLNSILDKLLV